VPDVPHFIVKVAPDEDRYVEWSTIVDAPLGWGTRAEMVNDLVRMSEKKEEFARVEAEKRLLRADVHGSSSFISDGGWDDAGFVVEQRGWLPRARLGAFLDSFDEAHETFDYDLLDPFEDDENVDDNGGFGSRGSR
jgi:hypothetical protein